MLTASAGGFSLHLTTNSLSQLFFFFYHRFLTRAVGNKVSNLKLTFQLGQTKAWLLLLLLSLCPLQTL